MGQAFKQMHRNKAMTFASVFAITAMLLILGIFFVTVVNIEAVANAIKDDYNTVEVFVKEKASQKKIDADMKTAKDWKGVSDVRFRTKEEAMKILKERWGKDAYLLEGRKENPLPSSIVIKVSTLEKANAVAEKAAKLQTCEDIRYYKDTVDKLLRVTKFIRIASLIIMGVLIIICIVVVSNTIKLTVMNRSDEISIMKYVGATNGFIRKPFVLEGLIIGALSAGIATGLVALIYHQLENTIGDQVMQILSMPMVDAQYLIIRLVVAFLAIGICVGALGSSISMRKYLDL